MNSHTRLFLMTGLTATLSQPVFAEEFYSDGIKIHYSVKGTGSPVVLIHGLGSSARTNWQFPGTADELSKHHQVILFDSRGHGLSDKPQTQDAYGEKMCDDVVRLLDHLNIRKAQVVGYSLGGFEVMKLLVDHPERVDSAVMCGAAWLKQGSPLDRFWANIPARQSRVVPPACMRGVSQLAVSESAVKAIKPKVALIVGDRDPCRAMYVEPAHRLRPDWPLYTVSGAGHFNCIFKQQFKSELQSALDSL